MIIPGDFAGVPGCFFGGALYSIKAVADLTVATISIHDLYGLFATDSAAGGEDILVILLRCRDLCRASRRRWPPDGFGAGGALPSRASYPASSGWSCRSVLLSVTAKPRADGRCAGA